MRQRYYFEYISGKLAALAVQIEQEGKLNILSLHVHAENFYLHFFNLLFAWQLKNLNAAKKNFAGLDLIEEKEKKVIQVSSTATKQKIESALGKISIEHKTFNFMFLSISKDASILRKQTYKNPHGVPFDATTDIHDNASILTHIGNLDAVRQKEIHNFIQSELGRDIRSEQTESNLASVIGILAAKDLGFEKSSAEVIPFPIEEKIEFNNLEEVEGIVNDYAAYHVLLDNVYSEFDRLGSNKSKSVLDAIRNEYFKCKAACTSSEELFFTVIENVIGRIKESSNCPGIPLEELELCANILVVDAFIRCKIFKNPRSKGEYAAA